LIILYPLSWIEWPKRTQKDDKKLKKEKMDY